MLLLLLPLLSLGVRLSVVDQDRVDIITGHYPTVESVEYLTNGQEWVNASFISHVESRSLSLAGVNWVALRVHLVARDAEGFETYRGTVVEVAPPAPPPPPPSGGEMSLALFNYGLMIVLVVGGIVGFMLYEKKKKSSNPVYVSDKDVDRGLAAEEFYQ